MRYCKNCGKEVKEGAQFCPNCGMTLQQNEGAEKKPATRVEQTQSIPKQPMTKKTKWILVTAAVAVIVLFSAYKVGAMLTSKDRLIDHFQKALDHKDAKAVANLLTTDDNRLKIDAQSVQSLLSYYKENPDKVTDLINDLKIESKEYDQSGKTSELGTSQNMIQLEKDGKILFYDKYELKIKPVFFTLQTNYKNTELLVDGKKVGKATKADYEHTYGPYMPGIHKAQAVLHSFVNLKKNKEISAESGDRPSCDLSLNGKDVTIDLGVGEENQVTLPAKLYVDGKDVGVNPFKNSTFGPVLTDGTMNVAVEAKMPWGDIKTNEVPIKGDTVSVSLANNDTVKKALMDTILQYEKEDIQSLASGTAKYTTVSPDFQATRSQAISDFVSGDEKYQGTLKNIKFDLNSFQAEFADGDNAGWQVIVNAEEKIHEATYTTGDTATFSDDSNDYTYTLEYDQKAKKWFISDVENNYSFDHSNLKTVGADGVASSVPSDVEGLMDRYENSMISAINDQDFNEVSDTLLPNSSLYQSQSQLVTTLGAKGTTEKLGDYEITGYQKNGSDSLITTHEKVEIDSSDGSNATKDFDWVYTAKTNNGTLLLSDIKKK